MAKELIPIHGRGTPSKRKFGGKIYTLWKMTSVGDAHDRADHLRDTKGYLVRVTTYMSNGSRRGLLWVRTVGATGRKRRKK